MKKGNQSIQTAIQILMGFIFLNTVASLALAESPALSADEIMEKVDSRYTGDSARADAQLILIDRRGRERVRDIRLFTLDQEGVEKSVSFFLSPSDVKDTAYMNYDYDDERDDDSWLYLPALKQVRRVAAGDKSGAFMGSDFSYSDINGVTLAWYDYKIIKDSEMVDDADTWVIESVPKPEFADRVASETGYEKSHIWVRKDNFVQVQSKIWVSRGKRIKYFSAQALEEIDGVWTPMRLQMVTTRNDEQEHASVFEFSRVQYNQDTDESLFTTQAMQRGMQ